MGLRATDPWSRSPNSAHSERFAPSEADVLGTRRSRSGNEKQYVRKSSCLALLVELLVKYAARVMWIRRLLVDTSAISVKNTKVYTLKGESLSGLIDRRLAAW